MMTNPTIRSARPNDRAALVNLLHQTDLLTDDLPADLSGFWLAFTEPESVESELVGSAGVEIFGQTGLLRSVAVRPDCRGRHIARQLLSQVRQHAQTLGLTNLYLITTTADRYFGRLGFAVVPREAVPEAIRQTRQFSQLCPDSAIVMHQLLPCSDS
jgi:amino-acid N-acetyltransferase